MPGASGIASATGQTSGAGASDIARNAGNSARMTGIGLTALWR
jgi:hypothetical protein